MTTIALLLGLVSTAAAQPTPPAPEPASPPGEGAPAPVPEAAPAVEDPAWSQYDQAYVELGKGRVDAAHGRLLELQTRWPAHPAAAEAARRVAELDARLQRRARSNSADRVARGELVFWSTAGSVLVAGNLCVDLCDSDRTTAAVYALTAGAGLGVSLLATRGGIRPAEAQLYNAAQTWGSWNGLAINDGFAEDRGEATIAIAAQFAGLGAGLGLWRVWRPDPGEVGLANSGLLWGTLLSLWIHLAADSEPTLQRVVVLGDLGIVAGALIAHQVPMSRGRTLLIDLGGVLGTLAGGLVTISSDSDQAGGTILTVSTAAGLVLAGVLTRDWDVKAPAGARIVPTRPGTPGAGAGWGAAVAFDLDL